MFGSSPSRYGSTHLPGGTGLPSRPPSAPRWTGGGGAFSGLTGQGDRRASPLYLQQQQQGQGQGRGTPVRNHKGGRGVQEASEWAFSGVDLPISGLSGLIASLESPEAARAASPSAASFGFNAFVPPSSASAAGSRSSSAMGQHGQKELWSAVALNTWKVELLAAPNASTTSLFLTYQHLDSYPSSETIPTTLLVGIKAPGPSAAGAKEEMLWHVWEDEWVFSGENEYWECHTLPSLSSLLALSPLIKSHDSLILSIQIQSPPSSSGLAAETRLPTLREGKFVPSNLLSALSGLFDDPTTSDVQIWCFEIRPSSSSTSGGGGGAELRKRVIYAHSAVLKARSSWWAGLLDLEEGGWSEKEGGKWTVKVASGAEYTTVLALIRYLYTNQILFSSQEQASDYDPSSALPDDNVLSGLNMDELGWGWFPSEALASGARVGAQVGTSERRRAGSLEDIDEDGAAVARVMAPTSPVPPHLQAQAGNPKPRGGGGKSAIATPARRRASGGASASSSTLAGVEPSATGGAGGGGGEPTTPVRAGRISPLGGSGRVSPALVRGTGQQQPQKEERRRLGGEGADGPHPDKQALETAADALAVYALAHRWNQEDLCLLALRHVEETLEVGTVFRLLLVTWLWKDLYAVVKAFALKNYYDVVLSPAFASCYTEVGEGTWPHGAEVLLDWTRELGPNPREGLGFFAP